MVGCFWSIGGPVYLQPVVNLNIEYFYLLLNSKVGHFNIKPMEVNSLNAIVDRVCKLCLTALVEELFVGDGTRLVELPVKLVETHGGPRVLHPRIPVS